MHCNTFYAPFKRIVFSAVLYLFLLNLQAAIIYVVNSESRTLSRIDTSSDEVQNSFAKLGLIPNKVIVDEDFLWCVNSGDNALQKLDRFSGATLANILIAAGCNPWDACLDGDFVYVTGLFTNKVYKVSKISNSVVGYLNVGISPEALCAYNGKLYVTNTGGYQNNYANSSVSVIDLASWQVVSTIPVQPNPQFIIEHNGLLHVSCTGNWVNTYGAVCVIDPASNEVIHTLNIGGSPGGIWVNPSHQALVGDGNGFSLFRYDTMDFSVLNDAANPLPNGGSVVTGTADFTAALYPNWGSNGKVRLLHPDLSFWKEYSVGMAPMDMKLYAANSALHHEEVSPATPVCIYPNPAHSTDRITFKTSGSAGKLDIYNLKGQLIKSLAIRSNTAFIDCRSIADQTGSGCYLFRFQSGNQTSAGKFIVLD